MILRLLTVLLFAANSCRAGDKVWSAVILASDPKRGEAPKPAPKELVRFTKQLSKVFHFEQFEIIGSATKSLDGQNERWLVPTQNFWLGATAQRKGAGYHLKLEFFHDKRRIVETEAMLGTLSPLFIRGPMHERGQIIVVFEIRP